MLVSCDPRNLQGEMPKVGSKGKIQVELPPNPAFSRKCIVCDTTLVRIESVDESETQFAMRIATVAFRDLDPDSMNPIPTSTQPATTLSA